MSSNASGRQAHFLIWRDANRLVVEVVQAVRRFLRFHMDALGTDK